MMNLIEDLNKRVKKLDMWDIALTKIGCIFAGIAAAKLLPQVLGVSIWWLVALIVLCAIRPLYVGYIK